MQGESAEAGQESRGSVRELTQDERAEGACVADLRLCFDRGLRARESTEFLTTLEIIAVVLVH
jgi:predicted secreted protein